MKLLCVSLEAHRKSIRRVVFFKPLRIKFIVPLRMKFNKIDKFMPRRPKTKGGWGYLRYVYHPIIAFIRLLFLTSGINLSLRSL